MRPQPQIKLPKNLKEATSAPEAKRKIIDLVRESRQKQDKIISPDEFYKEFTSNKQSKVFDFIEEMKTNKEVEIDPNGLSYIVEQNLSNGMHRFKRVRNREQLLGCISKAEQSTESFIKLKEHNLNVLNKKFLREDFLDGFGDEAVFSSQPGSSFQGRIEYSPIIGSPFFKQLYLYDYLLMHSKAFYYKNYSGIAKATVDITRNFVIGKGFNATISDQKAEAAWKRYEDYSNIHEKIRHWCDELCTFGEIMVKKVMDKSGINHITIDPSTIWEIVTEPENIYDVKYYHQQYSTQYQIYSDGKVPSSKYIIQQLPPSLINHYKVNCTTYEKRGRSDLLPAMLYLKYFEDYMIADLVRKKNEAAFIWDVTVKGNDDDVAAYISQTQSIVDVPPGSENVHNDAIERKPLSPSFSAKGPEDTASTILAYIGMSVSIPNSYYSFSKGGETRASALVKTEPVAKKMEERRLVIEGILKQCFKDVMIYNGMDPNTEVEFNFPEIIAEDRSSKIADVYLAEDKGTISHETASNIVAKELNITNYDYSDQMKAIEKERKDDHLFLNIDRSSSDLTGEVETQDDKDNRSFDRSSARDENSSL